MAKPQTLKADQRARTGSGVLKQMRREGFVPSVIYGGGTENQNVKVHAKTFRDMLNNAASDSILVNLDVEGAGTQLAFLQDVQHNALTKEILHVDFLAVSETTSITANLPLELTGEPVGVQEGGLLEHMLHSIEVSCLPKDLPESILADVSHLAIGEALHVGEMTLPEGVIPTPNADVVVALVAKARVEEEEEEVEGEEASTEPEVTSEAKTDDE
ncbi:MAG: 50S ribosomal protein L25 [Akkermansiaceae bacterium]|jgi:large subunit ribosomal protein L25